VVEKVVIVSAITAAAVKVLNMGGSLGSLATTGWPS
jgi:hypothetical protein